MTATATDLAGKTVLVRAEFANGVSSELAAIVKKFAARGARVAIIAGHGQPEGDVNPALSLLPFRRQIEVESGIRVGFISDCVGPEAEAGVDKIPFGEAVLLENLRFHPDERRDHRAFALRLSVLGDLFHITGPVPVRPAGWLTALSGMLPEPVEQQIMREDI